MSKRRKNTTGSKKKSKRKNVTASGVDMLPNGSLEMVHDKNEEIERLLFDAESEMDLFNYDAAAKSCNEVLGLNAENVTALEMLAGIYLEKGNLDEAETLLLRCIDLSPNDGYSKYFSLGQLSSGRKSLEFFQKGISIAEEGIKNDTNSDIPEGQQVANLQRVLSDAYCSVVELYMTDFCFEDDAEEMCKKAIESAIEADSSNFEAHQCLASYHCVKGEIEEAKSAIKQSLSLWLPQYEALLESQASDLMNNYQPPSYDSRINTSKTLIELEMFHEAGEVLEGLISEDDEVVEVWYLLGWLSFSQGEEYKRNAVHYFKKAEVVFASIGVADEDQIAHIRELLEELGDKYDSEEDEVEEKLVSDSESDSNDMET